MKILILAVDRDDDIGRKIGVRGPIIGREKCLKTAEALLLEDPSETDANAIFAALKIFDSLDESDKEVAVVTGDALVGYKSDLKIRKQLEEIFSKFKADGVILVSDGKEDEEVTPIVENFAPILSVNRITVSSNEEIKSIFYTIKNFAKRVVSTPEGRKLFFGIPGGIAVSYAILGANWWRLFSGLIGVYLLVKAGHYDKMIESAGKDFYDALKTLNIGFFFYVLSLLFASMAVIKFFQYGSFSSLTNFAKYLADNALLWFYASLSYVVGKILHKKPGKSQSIRLLGVSVIIGVIFTLIKQVALLFLDTTYPLSNIIVTFVLGIVVVTLIKRYI